MAEAIRIRRAEMRDMKAVFELSNDPVVRSHSIHKESIPWESHVTWFESAINRPDVVFLVAENEEGQFVGQIRFNQDADRWIVSISISQEFMGKGLTKGVLCDAMRQIPSGCFVAEIAPDNEASRRLFVSAGFVRNDMVERTPGFDAYTKDANVK